MSVAGPAAAPSSESSLRPSIGALLGILITINATVGTGIFRVPSRVARLTGSLPLALALWLAGAVIALAGALTLSELTAAMPRAGGLYEVLRRVYGPTVAFLLGWTKIVLLIPAAVGGLARLAAESLAALLHLAPDATRDGQLAVAVLAVAAAANCIGTRSTALGQAGVTVAKLAGLLVLIAAGLFLPVAAPAPAAPALAAPALAAPAAAAVTVASPLFGSLTALLAIMWTYDGWAQVASLGGELRDPGRTLPRALAGGTAIVAVLYLLANLAYARTLGLDGLRASSSGAHMVAANLAFATLGAAGRSFLSALLFVSALGATLAMLMASTRTFVPLATDGLFFRWPGVVHARTGVPMRAVLTTSALAAAYVLVRSFEQLTDAFVVGMFPFYVLAVLGLFRLRRRAPELPRPFRVPLYPLVPIVFLVGAAALLAGALHAADQTTLIAAAIALAGLPISRLWRRQTRTHTP